MVLPDRIELSTSPLPMECSTTELRQHARSRESARKAAASGPVLATRAPLAQARGRAGRRKKRQNQGVWRPFPASAGATRGRSGSPVPQAAPSVPGAANHTAAELVRFAKIRSNLTAIDTPGRLVAGIDRTSERGITRPGQPSSI